jgi:hypothetical protein
LLCYMLTSAEAGVLPAASGCKIWQSGTATYSYHLLWATAVLEWL